MNILKYFVAVVIVLLFLISGYLAWQNRSSEKIITGFLSILLIGSATTLVSTLFVMKKDIQKMEVTKTYVFNMVNKEPLVDLLRPYFNPISGYEHRIDLFYLVGAAIKDDPDAQVVIDEKGNSKTIEKGKDIYYRVFLAEVIETLCRNCNWMAKVIRRGNGGISFPKPPPDAKYSTITIKDFEQFFPDKALLSSHLFEFGNSFIVPKGTKLYAEEDNLKRQKKLILKNSFVKIDFLFMQSAGSVGVSQLGMLADISGSELKRYWSANFLIKIVATFNPYKAGHPMMELYHEWVDQIFNEFKYYFDSQDQWNKSLEIYSFYKDKPAFTKEQLMEIGKKEDDEFLDWLIKQPHKSRNN